MEKRRGLSIRSLLAFSAFGVLSILIIIVISINYYVNKAFDQFENLQLLDKISSLELRVQNLEKDFLLYETINPDFYKYEESKYIESINDHLMEIYFIIDELENSSILDDENLKQKAGEIKTVFYAYKDDLNKLNDKILVKGFKDYGLIGEMRNNIHDVESMVNERNDLQSSKFMLLLRRHEKDYLLRKI